MASVLLAPISCTGLHHGVRELCSRSLALGPGGGSGGGRVGGGVGGGVLGRGLSAPHWFNIDYALGWINFGFFDNFKLAHVACAQGGCKNHL